MQSSKKPFIKILFPLYILFILTHAIIFLLKQSLVVLKIDTDVLQSANVILFCLSILSILLLKVAAKNKNPNVFIRTVMLINLLKFFTVAISVLVYIKIAGSNRSNYAVVASMILFFVYTFFETKIALKMNKENGN